MNNHSIRLNAKILILFIIFISCFCASCSPLPTIISFYAEKESIRSGGHTDLVWEVRDAAEVYIDRIGNVSSWQDRPFWERTRAGRETVTPKEKTKYTLTAINAFGSKTKTVTIDITSYQEYTPPAFKIPTFK